MAGKESMIKAIETVYKGYRFRSRLEARWAVFFDSLGLEWQYELEGFDLGDGVYYLPDFWLSHQQIWLEIKGAFPDYEEIGKATRLAMADNHGVVITWANFDDKSQENTFVCYKDENNMLCSDSEFYSIAELLLGHMWPLRDPELQRAYLAARGARFERGGVA
jgi:hypothetical protein